MTIYCVHQNIFDFINKINFYFSGYFVSAVCDTDQAATYMGLGSFFPLAMLSGLYLNFRLNSNYFLVINVEF